jgi:YfiR/HmsC-like
MLLGGLCLGALASATLLAEVGDAMPGEYSKKAQMILGIVKNTGWPARKFSQPDSPIVIGIYGTDLISEYLYEDIAGRPINGRSVIVKHVTAIQELSGCHLVFVSRSERDRLAPAMRETLHENVLTVGESPDFLTRGGVIQFYNDGMRVRYQVSSQAVQRERLTVSGFVFSASSPQKKPTGAAKTGEVDPKRIAELPSP